MTRQFITVDYEATLQQTVTLEECLPAEVSRTEWDVRESSRQNGFFR